MAAPGMSMLIYTESVLHVILFFLLMSPFFFLSSVSHPPYHHAEAGKIQVHAGQTFPFIYRPQTWKWASVLQALSCVFTENHVSPRTHSSDAGGRVVSRERHRDFNVQPSVSSWEKNLTFAHSVLSFLQFDLHGARSLLPVPTEMVTHLFQLQT